MALKFCPVLVFYSIFFLFRSMCPSNVSYDFCKCFDVLVIVSIVKGISCQFPIYFISVDFVRLFRVLLMNVITSETVPSGISELDFWSIPSLCVCVNQSTDWKI